MPPQMGMKQPAPAKDSSSSIAKKPSAAQDINSFLSKTPPMAPQEFSPKGKFDTKKIPAAQHTTTPADRRLSRSNTDSSGHTDILPTPVPVAKGTKSKAGMFAALPKSVEASSSQTTKSSTRGSKRKQSSLEDFNEEEINSKRRTQLKKKSVSKEAGTSKKKPAHTKVAATDEIITVGFKFSRILAKGWQVPNGAKKPMWCYFVEWEEDEATNTEAGECTWEPVSMMKQDRKEMVELFEGRMQKENKTGPPSWDDVMEEQEKEVMVMEEKKKKGGKR